MLVEVSAWQRLYPYTRRVSNKASSKHKTLNAFTETKGSHKLYSCLMGEPVSHRTKRDQKYQTNRAHSHCKQYSSIGLDRCNYKQCVYGSGSLLKQVCLIWMRTCSRPPFFHFSLTISLLLSKEFLLLFHRPNWFREIGWVLFFRHSEFQKGLNKGVGCCKKKSTYIVPL